MELWPMELCLLDMQMTDAQMQKYICIGSELIWFKTSSFVDEFTIWNILETFFDLSCIYWELSFTVFSV